jgi:hypothetical protein
MQHKPGIIPLLFLAGSLAADAQEKPYFVTYDHHMEEPGSLELAVNSAAGHVDGVNFLGSSMELEYGAKGWWTTELYLDAQSTARDSTVFTGFRWENRFRVLMGEHWINPVLYVEFEDINGADKTLKEVVGFDGKEDFAGSNAALRTERKREMEAKLILSSQFHNWNIAENFIAEKNLAHGPWEFGYAVGASRPLALAASARECVLCLENLRAGIEFYGGLGNWRDFAIVGTSHYIAPIVAWALPRGVEFRLSPTFGLTRNSLPVFVRFVVSYELAGFGRQVRRLFR